LKTGRCLGYHGCLASPLNYCYPSDPFSSEDGSATNFVDYHFERQYYLEWTLAFSLLVEILAFNLLQCARTGVEAATKTHVLWNGVLFAVAAAAGFGASATFVNITKVVASGAA
jgi:hypothetical protein